MPVAVLRDPSGQAIGRLNIPDGASPEAVQQIGERAMLAARARQAAVQANHPDPDLYVRQIGTESSFRADAVGPVTKSGERAVGPAQFMPATARERGVVPGGDPTDDLRGGAEYSRDLIQKYGTRNGVAAYNAGPGNVEKYGGVPPFPETQGYVEKIVRAEPGKLATQQAAPPPAPTMPRMTDAADPVDRAPRPALPPNALASMDPPFRESQPYEPGGPIERAQGGQALLDASPFLLPAGATYRAAAAIGASHAAVREGIDQFQNGQEPDWKSIGKAALLGGAVGAVAHGFSDLAFGRISPERRAAEETLGMGGFTDPVPITPRGRANYAAEVDDALFGVLPPQSREAVGEAYAGFRQAVGARPIDVTAYNRTLQHYADVRFPGERLPAPARLLDPVGQLVQIPGRAPRWFASAEDVLASERGLSFAAGTKNATGQPSLPGGLMKALRGDLGRSLNQGLTPAEQAAYQAARDTALAVSQRERAVRLLTSKTMTDGSAVNVGALASRLEKAPEKYRQALGDGLYTELLTTAQAGRTLLMQPGGRQLFSQVVARMAGAGVGAAVGSVEYGTPGAVGGAVVGGLAAPHVLSVLERLARTRATSGQVAEGAGRLAVALALEDEPKPQPAAPQPFPAPSPTPRPLGTVGVR